MREVICRFEDREELHRHFDGIDDTGPVELSFLGAFDAAVGEPIQIAITVEEGGARCRLRATIVSREELGREAARRRGLESFRARVCRDDQIWMQMMLRQLAMWRSFHPHARSRCPAPAAARFVA
jgi:hypothetical protein